MASETLEEERLISLHIITASVGPLPDIFECILFSCFWGQKLFLGCDKPEDIWLHRSCDEERYRELNFCSIWMGEIEKWYKWSNKQNR